MPTWSRREKTVTTVEWLIPAPEPWGACWNEVYNVIDMSIEEYKRMKGEFATPSDDAIRVRTEDDVIVVSYVKEESRSSGSQQMPSGISR